MYHCELDETVLHVHFAHLCLMATASKRSSCHMCTMAVHDCMPVEFSASSHENGSRQHKKLTQYSRYENIMWYIKGFLRDPERSLLASLPVGGPGLTCLFFMVCRYAMCNGDGAAQTWLPVPDVIWRQLMVKLHEGQTVLACEAWGTMLENDKPGPRARWTVMSFEQTAQGQTAHLVSKKRGWSVRLRNLYADG